MITGKKTVEQYKKQFPSLPKTFLYIKDNECYLGGILSGSFVLPVNGENDIHIDSIDRFSIYLPEKNSDTNMYKYFHKEDKVVFEIKDLEDALILLYQRDESFNHNVYVFFHLKQIAYLESVSFMLPKNNYKDPQNIYFYKDFSLYKVSNGKEVKVDLSAMTLKEWSDIWGDHLENEYALVNDVQFEQLLWNSNYMAKWKCLAGHHLWKETVESRTSKVMHGSLSLCLECERIRDAWEKVRESKKSQWIEKYILQLEQHANLLSNGEHWLKKEKLPREIEY